jgi:hypothetical protein
VSEQKPDSAEPPSGKLTKEQKDRILAEALEIVRLNQEQRPVPVPRTPDEEVLARLD